jgi:CelD/BcsL family acetyltransferase involved in cellulose biosynthesis
MRIDVLRPSELTPAHLAAWRAFQAADAALASPFLTPEWPLAVEAAGAGDVRIAVQSTDARPQAFLAVKRGRYTAMAAGAPLSDAQAVLAAPGARIDLTAMLSALGVQRFDFTHAPTSDSILAPGFRGRTDTHFVDLTGGWAGYQAELKARKSDLIRDAGRRTRRAEKEVGAVRFTLDNTNLDDFRQVLDWKRAQYAETRQTDVLRPAWSRRLLEQLFETREPAFGTRFSTLHIGDRLACGHLALCAGDLAYAWFIAHHCDFSRHSPGLVLMVELTRHLAEEGRWRAFDLGPGDYLFKQRLCNAERPLAYGFVGRPSPAAAFRSAAYRVRNWAEAAPLGRVSALPGKAMRRWDVIRALA